MITPFAVCHQSEGGRTVAVYPCGTLDEAYKILMDLAVKKVIRPGDRLFFDSYDSRPDIDEED